MKVMVLWTNDAPWRPLEKRRRWYRHGQPWEVEHLHLDQFVDDEGGWRVAWSQRRHGDLVCLTEAEAMAAVRWVVAQGGEWVEVDPGDISRVTGGGRPGWGPGGAPR